MKTCKTINTARTAAAKVACTAMLALTAATGCGNKAANDLVSEEETAAPALMYGIEYEKYDVMTDKVRDGQTLSHIMGSLGVSPAMIDRVDRTSRPVFDMRRMRAGNTYAAFLEHDSLGQRLHHFVYEKNPLDYVVVSLVQDSVIIAEGSKDVNTVRRRETASIDKEHNSLWLATMAADMPASLPCEIENIFGWSVDFFSLQEGDEFTVIFDERWIDTVRVGTGMIWGAEFTHNGRRYRATPFRQGGRLA